MRIMLVEPNGTGGLAHFAHQLCTALAGQGAEVVLVTAANYELAGLARGFRVDPCLKLWSIHGEGEGNADGGRLWRVTRTLRRIPRALRFAAAWQGVVGRIAGYRPDVVVFSIMHFPFQWVFLEQLRRRGLTLTQICHEFQGRDGDGPGPGAAALAWMERRLYGCFSAIMFLAEDTRASFLSRFPGLAVPTAVIPHGTQDLFTADPACMDRLRRRYGVAEGERVILFFGTIRPSKGLPDLVDAFALLDGRVRARTRLVIAGFPSKHMDMQDLRRRIAGHGLSDAVVLDLRYLPNEEMGSLICLGDVVVFPYRNATQSGALYLAYAFARPVVATTVGGLAESLEDGVTGLGVPPADPAALSAAIARLLDDPAHALSLGETGRQRSRAANAWPRVAEAVLAVQVPLLPPRAKPSPFPNPDAAGDGSGQNGPVATSGQRRARQDGPCRG